MKKLQIMLVAIILVSIFNLLISNSQAQENWKACSITELLLLSNVIDDFNEQVKSWDPDDPDSFMHNPSRESEVVEDLPFCRESIMYALTVTNSYTRVYLLALLNKPLALTERRKHSAYVESLAVSEALWGTQWFGFGDLFD